MFFYIALGSGVQPDKLKSAACATGGILSVVSATETLGY